MVDFSRFLQLIFVAYRWTNPVRPSTQENAVPEMRANGVLRKQSGR
jgi:hypothetical protein